MVRPCCLLALRFLLQRTSWKVRAPVHGCWCLPAPRFLSQSQCREVRAPLNGGCSLIGLIVPDGRRVYCRLMMAPRRRRRSPWVGARRSGLLASGFGRRAGRRQVRVAVRRAARRWRRRRRALGGPLPQACGSSALSVRRRRATVRRCGREQAAPSCLLRSLLPTLRLRGPVGMSGRSLRQKCGSSRSRPSRRRTSWRRPSGTRLWAPCRTKQALRLVVPQKVRILDRRCLCHLGSRRRLRPRRPRHWRHACPSLWRRAIRIWGRVNTSLSRLSRLATRPSIRSGRVLRCSPSRMWLQPRRVLR